MTSVERTRTIDGAAAGQCKGGFGCIFSVGPSQNIPGTNAHERGRQADDGGRRERGRVWDYWHFKYGCVPGHSSTTLQFQPEHLPCLPPPRCRRRRLQAQAYFCKWAAAFQISVPFGAVAQTEQSRASPQTSQPASQEVCSTIASPSRQSAAERRKY